MRVLSAAQPRIVILSIPFIILVSLVFLSSDAAAQTGPAVVFNVDYANCVNHINYVISGEVLNPNAQPVYVSEVMGSFYSHGGTLLFTGDALLAFPVIASGGSSPFTITVTSGGCSQVTSYQLQAVS